jgi:hypothetical protein
MTERHPHELLASYVDGELGAEERRQVEAHLGSCARCTEEVGLARQAFSALSALEEVPAPLGLATPAIQQARPQKRWAGRLQWAAGSAAAAALIVAIGIVLWRSTDTGQMEDAAAPAVESATNGPEGGVGAPLAPNAADSLSFYTETTADYSREELDSLARRDKALVYGDQDAVTIRASSDDRASEAVDRALECAGEAGLRADEGSTLDRIEAARFEGTPVYIVFSTEEDGTHNVWVVDREECQIRYVASSSG